MTRQEQLNFCSVCTKKSFNPKSGIVCGLTNEVAAFEGSCADFVKDEQEAKHENLRTISRKKDANKSIRHGRTALFVIGGLYVLVGFYEGLLMEGHELLFGLIDWGAAAVFIGLGVWSYQKPFLAMILGLAFYVAIILLIGVIDPTTIIQGIIWKFLIIFYLGYGISNARAEEANEKQDSGDILDQI